MPQQEKLRTLFPLEDPNSRSIRQSLMTGFNGILENIFAINKIKNLYEGIPACSDPFQFLECALDRLQIRHRLGEEERRAIPSSGSAIVVANHPFGGIDGMVLASALSSVRRDIRILTNYFLEKIEGLNPLFFPVDPFNQKGASLRNIASMRKAIRWVKAGGMLVVLPAGEVSHFSWKRRKVEDPQWSHTVGRMVRLTEAPVLPVYFEGRNSALFQIAGIVHPRLRTAMLPRETIRKEGSKVQFKIGRLISYKNLSKLEDPYKLTEYLRFRTYLLGMGLRKVRSGPFAKGAPDPGRRMEKIARAVDKDVLAKEVQALPDDQKLLTSCRFSVYYAKSHQIPMILREIGRRREETFRETGEGTGRSIDLDRFDNIYIHLFVWSNLKNELVGAYRVGSTLEILPRHGKKGLYTHTLFKYSTQLLTKTGPALELGRSFIRNKYQKDYSPLLLLFQGVGHYIARHPYYKTLFGAVSISNSYGHYSRQLMAAFLQVKPSSSDLSRMVKPRRPFSHNKVVPLLRGKEAFHGNDPDELSSWISCMEKDGKGVPVLLKHYLKLGGKVLSFNLDHHFSNALDGLIFIDLSKAAPKLLKRYMGEAGFQKFMEYHLNDPTSSAFGHGSLPQPKRI